MADSVGRKNEKVSRRWWFGDTLLHRVPATNYARYDSQGDQR